MMNHGAKYEGYRRGVAGIPIVFVPVGRQEGAVRYRAGLDEGVER